MSDQLIYEIIHHGSIFEALSSKSINPLDILYWLTKHPVTISSIIAYRAICLYYPFNQHYLSNNNQESIHFIKLANKLEYSIVFVLSGGDYRLKSQINSNNSNSSNDDLFQICTEVYFILQYETDFSRRIRLICDDLNVDTTFTYEDINIIISSRSINLFNIVKTLFHKRQYLNSIFQNDFISEISECSSENVLDLLIERINFLKHNVPNYWSIICKSYSEVVKKRFNNVNHFKSQQQYQNLYHIFPEILSKDPLNLLPEAFNLLSLPKETQYYLLGIPFDYLIPSEDEINRTINFLSTEGIDKFCSKISEQNRKLFYDNSSSIVNSYDTLMEDPISYSPFDIIKFNDKGKIYIFTRPEFHRIVRTGKNHWNNLPLPDTIIQYIGTKITISKIYHLPSPKPLNDLFQDLKDNKIHRSIDTPLQFPFTEFASYLFQPLLETFRNQLL